MKVLVVDDSKATLEIVRRSLEQFGYRHLSIKKTNNPIEALSMVDEWQPEILLTDWNMPEISGIELIKRVRRKGVSTQIGMITTVDDEAQINDAIESGANFVLNKPFDDEQLFEKLLPLVQGVEQSEVLLDDIPEVSDGLALPELSKLDELLKRVVDKDLATHAVKAQCFDESKLPCFMAIYEDTETQRLRSVVLLDIYAACVLSRANKDITVGHLQKVVKLKKPSKYVMETCQQVMAKASLAFLDHHSHKNLRLKKLTFVETTFDKLESLYQTPVNRRLDIACQLDRLAQGKLTILGF